MLREHEAAARHEPTIRDLVLWHLACRFVEDAERLFGGPSRACPREWPGQLGETAFTLPLKIADGLKYSERTERRHYINKAIEAVEEVRHSLLLATEVRYADIAPLLRATAELTRLLEGYMDEGVSSGAGCASGIERIKA